MEASWEFFLRLRIRVQYNYWKYITTLLCKILLFATKEERKNWTFNLGPMEIPSQKNKDWDATVSSPLAEVLLLKGIKAMRT